MPSATHSTTTSSPHFSQDVIDLCFDFLGDDTTTLKKCLFVSPATLPACRRNLFRTVKIHTSIRTLKHRVNEICDQFRAFWNASPHLLRYVKDLVVETDMGQKELRQKVMACFAECKLRAFRLVLYRSDQDDGFEDVANFLTTWSRTSLRTLEFKDIGCFPYRLIRSFPNLKFLGYNPAHDAFVPIIHGRIDESLFPTAPIFTGLRELEISDCLDDVTGPYFLRCIDFPSLRKLSIIHGSDTVSTSLEALLNCAAPHIEELVWRPANMVMRDCAFGEAYPTLRLTRFPKLRSLEIRGPHLKGWLCDRNIASWIRKTLRELPPSSPLETVALDFPFRDLYQIDTSLTTAGFCPHPHPSGQCPTPPDIELSSGRARKQFAELDLALTRLENLKLCYLTTHLEGKIEAFKRLREQGKFVLRRRIACRGEALTFWNGD